MHATGGGAYKYQDLFEQEFEGKVKLRKHDEMQSLVDGMTFVLANAKNSSYTFREGEGKKVVETIVPGVTNVQDSSEHKKEEDKDDND